MIAVHSTALILLDLLRVHMYTCTLPPRQVGPDFVFHVVGSNAVPDTIQRLNGTMVDGIVRIVVHGFVPNLKAFYNNMRVSVRTSTYLTTRRR